MDAKWWRRAVFYQVYPRSFFDLNGDGVGDLDGLTSRLDYLNDGTPRSLGIDAIWLSPINPSPLKDWGYDVSDYCGIHPDLGDLKSFDRLIEQAHRRNIRVILDLVPNHTSDEHPWFVESRSSTVNAKRNWYLWADGRDGGPPNNWLAAFGGPAWEFDDRTGQWYMHSFLAEQPDLNYRNPEVVAAMEDVMRFWLDRGADGFRIDVISYLAKDAALRDNPPRTDRNPFTWRDLEGLQVHLYDQDIPEVHGIIRGFRRLFDRYPDRMMIGEVWPREQLALRDYLRPDELHLAFNFAFLRRRYTAQAFRAVVDETEELLGPTSWPTNTLSNHDVVRHITRHADGERTEARARLLAVMMMTLRGTPFIYYGEEIGMKNVGVPAEHQRDRVFRDGCRTPMQWSEAPHGGFTTGAEPWLPCGDFHSVNVMREIDDPRSMLALYRDLIRLRRNTPALLDGSYLAIDTAAENCFAYRREVAGQRILVALNFGARSIKIEAPPGRILLSSRANRGTETVNRRLSLLADEAAVIDLAD